MGSIIPQTGKFRHIVFRDGGTWYAVALEFNIVESSDDPKLAFFSLLQAVGGYVESIKRIESSKNYAPLNQKLDSDYEDLWNICNSQRPVKPPYQVDMFGYVAI